MKLTPEELQKLHNNAKSAAPFLAAKIEQLEGIIAVQKQEIESLRREIGTLNERVKLLDTVKASVGKLADDLGLMPDPYDFDDDDSNDI